MIRTRTVNELTYKLGRVCNGRPYLDTIHAAALLTVWSVFHAYDTHEERLLAIEGMEALIRQELLDLQTYIEKKEGEGRV